MMGFTPCILADFGASLVVWAIQTLIVMSVTTYISYRLSRRNRSQLQGAGAHEFTLPTAQEGRPLPVVFGKRDVKSPNGLTPIFNFKRRRKKRHGQTVYYRYYVGLHLGICHAGIDGIKQIWAADKCLWPTYDDPSVEAADATVSATISAPRAFGGVKREGGVIGTVAIQYGGASQTLHSYLSTYLGSIQPAYRGMIGVILQQVYIGTVPMMRPWAFVCKRTQKLTDGSTMWYLAKAAVGADGDLNAIHIIYELLTSNLIGRGLSTSLIGSSFTTAADTCYTEGYGLSAVWDSAPDDVESLIEQIEHIIDGKLYLDPSTGTFEIGLARADYEVGSLESFGADDFWVERMPTTSVGRVPSKTIVHYYDRSSRQKRPAFDDNIALLAVQGSNPISQEYDYSNFVCSPVLAGKIAAREQYQVSAMPKALTLRCLRTMSGLHENSVFTITYPALKIATMVVRVVSVDRGSLTDGEVTLQVVEDVYGLAYTVYGAPPAAAPGETDPAAQVDIDYYTDTGTGTVTWDDGEINIGTDVYEITGSTTGTTDQYIWFDAAVSETELQHGASAPTSGTAVLVWENVAGVVTASNEMESEDTVAQGSAISDHWRHWEDTDDRLHLQYEEAGTWADEVVYGDVVAGSDSPSASPSVTPSASPSSSKSGTPSASPSGSGSTSPSPSASPSASSSQGTPSASVSGTPSTSVSASPSRTVSSSPSGSISSTPSASPSEGTPSASTSQTPSASPSASPSEGTPSSSKSVTPSTSLSSSASSSLSPSPSTSESASPSSSESASPSSSPSQSPSASPSSSASS